MKRMEKTKEEYLVIYRNELGGYSVLGGPNRIDFFFNKNKAIAEAEKLEGAEVYKKVMIS